MAGSTKEPKSLTSGVTYKAGKRFEPDDSTLSFTLHPPFCHTQLNFPLPISRYMNKSYRSRPEPQKAPYLSLPELGTRCRQGSVLRPYVHLAIPSSNAPMITTWTVHFDNWRCQPYCPRVLNSLSKLHALAACCRVKRSRRLRGRPMPSGTTHIAIAAAGPGQGGHHEMSEILNKRREIFVGPPCRSVRLHIHIGCFAHQEQQSMQSTMQDTAVIAGSAKRPKSVMAGGT